MTSSEAPPGWQLDNKLRAIRLIGANVNLTVMVFHYSTYDGQTQSCAVFLGRKIRLENPRPGFSRQAGTIVGDFDGDALRSESCRVASLMVPWPVTLDSHGDRVVQQIDDNPFDLHPVEHQCRNRSGVKLKVI